MKNVTITLDEELVRRARIEAATEGVSLSKFVSALVEARLGRRMSQKEAAERFLSGPLWPLSDQAGKLPSRTEMHDERTDHLLRGHERPALPERRKKPAKA